MFLGENLIVYLVLALGGALAFGNFFAIVKPPQNTRDEGDLEKAPVVRSVVMGLVGLVAAVWAIASLISG
ncbi:MAG: hypothetical protein RIR69_674 [Actinomycetota bacterium]|jgi:hypothetical protein